MANMVERVARAIVATVPGAGNVDEHMNNPVTRQIWMSQARAALTAMLEPTDAMKQCGRRAGWSGVIEGIDEDEEDAASRLYTFMIETAIKEDSH